MGKIVGFEIGDHSVKLAYFAGNELKKAVCAELPDAMVSHGRILSMDAMADFLRDTAGQRHSAGGGGGVPVLGGCLYPGRDHARHDGAAAILQSAL